MVKVGNININIISKINRTYRTGDQFRYATFCIFSIHQSIQSIHPIIHSIYSFIHPSIQPRIIASMPPIYSSIHNSSKSTSDGSNKPSVIHQSSNEEDMEEDEDEDDQYDGQKGSANYYILYTIRSYSIYAFMK